MRLINAILTGVLLFIAIPVQAEEVTKAVVREGVRAAFEEFERQMIYKYFDAHPVEVVVEEGGYGKKGRKKGLPPGIQKKLDRGGTLPPGIAKQYLPDDLNRDLPPAPAGYERIIYGTDVLLVEIDTRKVADIVTDAILGD